ncbi:MAG: LysM peptidoglycan-binding domain-containing protein, partial [Planctomycetota bacterium]|nr:LysM peptidoglycan-binding domain-containing protein [Planctomycetota bacterium]
LARELAMYNKIADPNKVNEGRRLRIPKKPEVLIRGEMALQSNSISPASKPMATTSRPEPALLFTMYTIKTGDILSRLSQDLLGTTRRMKELQELNRDVIKNPDRLIPGTVIKVPKN